MLTDCFKLGYAGRSILDECDEGKAKKKNLQTQVQEGSVSLAKAPMLKLQVDSREVPRQVGSEICIVSAFHAGWKKYK